MRYVQINTYYSGSSTGTIMRRLHGELAGRGVDSYILWGRNGETLSDHEQRFATWLGVRAHGAGVRLFDRMGFYSRRDTARLLRRLGEIDPDVVHLHNLHGYYVNVEMLFGWLASHRCKVLWTLHDCWAFTGHCAHFTCVGCDQWRTGCARSAPCPQLGTYPKTLCKMACVRNYEDKRRVFNMVPADRMRLVTPSEWLAGLVRESFLSKYPVEVRRNTVDASVFKPTSSDFRERYGIGDRFVVLGVASPWTERKGLPDFLRLADELGGGFAVVLVGLSKRQVRDMPARGVRGCAVVALPRTSTAEELAGIYAAADVFFNPTREDTYPTVNLEAEACGTPVVTYDVGGCRETLSLPGSSAVPGYAEALGAVLEAGAR